MYYDADNYAEMVAELMAKKEYDKTKPGQYYVLVLSALSSVLLWFGAKLIGLAWAAVLYYLAMLFACVLVFIAGSKLYGFLEGDLRSTDEYMHYKKSGVNFFLTMLPSIAGIICLAKGNNLVYWIIMVISSLIMIVIASDLYVKTSAEFGPDNGRYTFRLKIAIRGKYTDEELVQLYNTLSE